MLDRYFPGFQFAEYQRPPWLTRGRLESVNRNPTAVGGESPDPNRHTQKEVRQIFSEGLSSLGEKIGEHLSMRGRRLLFVSKSDMKPKTEEERKALVERYGEYIVDGSGGGCRMNPDGTFTLRVVDDGQSVEDLFGSRLHTVAHEFGHSIGDLIFTNPVDGELKAYAFQELFIHHLLGVRNYSPPREGHVHDTAWFRLQQLRNAGIEPEAMIAHLVSRPFGRHHPEDYRYVVSDKGIVGAQALQAS